MNKNFKPNVNVNPVQMHINIINFNKDRLKQEAY